MSAVAESGITQPGPRPIIETANNGAAAVLRWGREGDTKLQRISAYSVEYLRTSGGTEGPSTEWTTLPIPPAAAYTYIIDVKLDEFSKNKDSIPTITSGSFRLQWIYTRDHPSMVPDLKVSSDPIYYNADARDMKTALESPLRVSGDHDFSKWSVVVRRCDETEGWDVDGSWVGGCPYGASRHAYQWHVIVTPPDDAITSAAATGSQISYPTLQFLDAHLPLESIWTGEGPQITCTLLPAPQLSPAFTCGGLTSPPHCELPVADSMRLEPLATYVFRIIAYNAAGPGSPSKSSDPFTPKVALIPSVPSAPSVLSTAVPGVISVALAHEIIEASAYEFQVADATLTSVARVWTSIPQYVPAPVSGIGSLAVATISDLVAGVSYVFRARGVRHDGVFGSWSTDSKIVVAEGVPPPPKAPSSPVLEDGESPSTLKLVWGPLDPTDAEYVFQWQKEWEDYANEWSNAVLETDASNPRTAIITGLEPYTKYRVRVAIKTTGAWSDWSPPSEYYRTSIEIVAVPSLPVPNALPSSTDLPTITSILSTSAVVKWSAWRGTFSPIQSYTVDLSIGNSDGFSIVKTVKTSLSGGLPAPLTATLTDLAPSTSYRVRVCGLPLNTCTSPVTFSTAAAPADVWTRIDPRVKRGMLGGGYTAPAALRPFDAVDSLTADSPAAALVDPRPTAGIPAPRSGHSLITTSIGHVYMYGGRSFGEPCGAAVATRKGVEGGASPVLPCTARDGLVSELWRFQPFIKLWEEVIVAGAGPPAREKHTASVVGAANMIILGGKDASGAPISLSSVWSIDLAPAKTITATWAGPSPQVLTEGVVQLFTAQPLTADSSGQCVASLTVSVTIDHPCSRQLQVELRGPSLKTADANNLPPGRSNVVRLFKGSGTTASPSTSTAGGCDTGGLTRTVFDDSATDTTTVCCGAPWTGSYRPLEPLSAQFAGSAAAGVWTLAVYDNEIDGLIGTLSDFTITMNVSPCGGPDAALAWTQVTAGGTVPPARFGHAAVAVGTDQIFIYWGRGASNLNLLGDLYRLDLAPAGGGAPTWTQLATTSTPAPYLVTPPLQGSSLLLSPWGLLAVGGVPLQLGSGSRSTFGAGSGWGTSVESSVWLMDMGTKQWRKIDAGGEATSTAPSLWRDSVPPLTLHETAPEGRRFAAVAVFPPIETGATEAVGGFLLHGGWDGIRLMGDLWRLDLPATAQTASNASDRCRSKLLVGGTADTLWKSTCSAATSTSAPGGQMCSFLAAVERAWCLGQSQGLGWW